MSKEKKTVELTNEELEKVCGGVGVTFPAPGECPNFSFKSGTLVKTHGNCIHAEQDDCPYGYHSSTGKTRLI